MVYQLPSSVFHNELGKGLVMASPHVGRERVMVFIVGSASRIIGANTPNRYVYPSEYARIADGYYQGDVMVAYACMDTRESARALWDELDEYGYIKLAPPLTERKSPIIEYLPLLYRDAARVDRIIFVAEKRMVPDSFIGGMRMLGVEVTILTPRTKVVPSRYTETIIPISLALEYLVASNDTPLVLTLASPSYPTLPTPPQPTPQSALEKLVEADMPSADLAFDVFSVTASTVDACRERLDMAHTYETLHPILTAALLVLSTMTTRASDGAHTITTDRIWRELLDHGIDIADAGMPAISLLLEEHVIHRLENGELLLVRDRPDPLLMLAQAFHEGLHQERDRIPQIPGLPDFASAAIDAISILKDNPSRLTGEKRRTLVRLLRGLFKAQPPKNKPRAWWYRQHGLPAEMVGMFERLAMDKLGCTPDEPVEPIEDEPSHDGERASTPSGTSLTASTDGSQIKALAG